MQQDDSLLGDWVKDIDSLSQSFSSATPFPHVVIPNFFKTEVAEKLYESFPEPGDQSYHRYWNPLEKKLALNNFTGTFAETVFQTLQTDSVVNLFSQMVSIPDLQADPHLHGAGLHYMPSGGKLDMHLDYSIHPITKKERRVNLIVYLNPRWEKDWGGNLELWNSEFTKCEKEVAPEFNTGVLFQTSDISYHGLPRPIRSPDVARRSIAIYYVSEPREHAAKRYKAQFRPLPDQPMSEGLKELYKIRQERIITPADLLEHMGPDWESLHEGQGYWW
jgi:hypothetical protein